MQQLEQLEQLALDALHERRMNRQGCFVHNAAGIELIGCTQEALPVIEQILECTVEPVLCDSREGERVTAIRDRLRKTHGSAADRMPIRSPDFPGIDYLLGAYLVITAKSDPQRAVRFLAGSSVALKVEAVRAIPLFFRLMKYGYNFHTAPPSQFRDFVQHLASSESHELRSAAEFTLRGVTWAS